MANKSLFRSALSKLKSMVTNRAGGKAYALAPAHALAQLAATGCLNGTFYTSDEKQLKQVIDLAAQLDPLTVAQIALYSRDQAKMKDMPAVLCAVLASSNGELLEKIFPRVIDSPKMLRNFVQIMRSGKVGRKSLGSRPRRLVRQWLESRTDDQLFRATVGNDPSLADIIRLAHPRPSTPSRQALYGYILDKQFIVEALPPLVRQFEAFKASLINPTPTKESST